MKTVAAILSLCTLASCAFLAPEPAPRVAAGPIRIEQVGHGKNAQFVVCADCRGPTRKTILVVESLRIPAALVVEQPAAPIHVEPPVPQAESQAEAADVKTPITYSIFFQHKRAQVNLKDMLKVLDRLLQPAVRAEKITISAFTDCSGKKQHNKELASKRAKNTREWLIKQGVPANIIEIADADMVNSTGAWKTDDDKPSRRVDINILSKEGNTVGGVRAPSVGKAAADTLLAAADLIEIECLDQTARQTSPFRAEKDSASADGGLGNSVSPAIHDADEDKTPRRVGIRCQFKPPKRKINE